MRHFAAVMLLVFSGAACAQAAAMKSEASSAVPGTGSNETERSAAAPDPSVGRFQMVVVAGPRGAGRAQTRSGETMSGISLG